ncbi:MAG: iron-containing alcohol dehydrogenase [Candidatus Sigynarchaeota archaeon]
MDPFNFHVPVKLHFGRGQLGVLGSVAKELGKKALLVTHPWHDSRGDLLPQAKSCEEARNLLEKEGVDVIVYDRVQPNPDVVDIDAGAAIARGHGTDIVVGMGGGSAMDSAKAISLVASLGGSAWDYLFFKKPTIARGLLPVITVTTTSGTGSHMTNIAVVSNRKTSEKYPIVNSRLYPVHAICDPELMLTIPAQPTVEMGFDVFAHAFESYTARNASPIIDVLALDAMRIVSSTLTRLSVNLHDITLREAMALADTLDGI